MNNQDEQIKLRQQLCLMCDAYITLSDNPAWVAMIVQYPELESLRQQAVSATDSVWYAVRSRVITLADM